jgi:hypothetical protein
MSASAIWHNRLEMEEPFLDNQNDRSEEMLKRVRYIVGDAGLFSNGIASLRS